jgi:hypothetical protein
MGFGETERQTVKQHIALGYRNIARQFEIIEALRRQGYPTEGAERRLAELKRVLQSHKEHLARLQNSE